MEQSVKDKKFGRVALVGRPNVGKSTLLNQILKEELAIITPRPQTTRHSLLGVKHLDNAQIAFIDTPGLHSKGHPGKTLLNRYMMEETKNALERVDVVVYVLDAAGLLPAFEKGTGLKNWKEVLNSDEQQILSFTEYERKYVVVLNKTDLVSNKNRLLPLISVLQDSNKFAAIVPICALDGEGVDSLLTVLGELLPVGVPEYDVDMLTDRSERFLAAEKIREQVFLSTYQEIPYSVAVTIDDWQEAFYEHPPQKGARRHIEIHATIHVEKETQKRIVVGERGAMIREIGSNTRQILMDFFGCNIGLFLFVRVDKDWSQTEFGLKEMGYEG